MSRPWTGWVLTAAVMAALPAPALSSNDTSNESGQDLRPMLSVAGDDGDYTNCLEVSPGRQPQDALQTMKGPPVDVYVRGRPAGGIAADIARAKRGAADAATPEPLLIDRDLATTATARPAAIKAACGIPRGLTLLVPVERESRAAPAS